MVRYTAILGVLTLVTGGATAQTTNFQTVAVYYETGAPATVAAASSHPRNMDFPGHNRYPRLNRLMQSVIDPTILFRSVPSAGFQPSDKPFLDALPSLASLGFGIAELAFTSPIFSWTTAFVPQVLRTIRVVRRGPPPGLTARRDVVLWIASPTASRAQMNYRQHGRLIWPPLRERPLMQRLLRR